MAEPSGWAVVHEAKELLVTRFGYQTDEALAHLQRLARDTDAEVKAVAAALLQEAGLDTQGATGERAAAVSGAFDPAQYLRSPPEAGSTSAGQVVRGTQPPETGVIPTDLTDESGRFLAAASTLAAAKNADELASLLHNELRGFGSTAALLMVAEAEGAVRVTGVAGPAEEAFSEWSELPVQLSLPLARMAMEDQVVWLDDDQVGDHMLVWGSTGTAVARAGSPEDRLFVAVSASWTAEPPTDERVRRHLEGLVAAAGQRLLGLAIMGLPAGDLRAPWLDAVLDTIPTPAALLFPIRDPDGQIVEFSIDRCNAQATDLQGRTPEQITGQRLLEAFPGMMLSGIFEAYVKVLDTGEALHRGPFAYEDLVQGVLYPSVLSVRAQKIGEGLLVSWQFHDEQARLAAQLEHAERLVHLGWAEWNLVTNEIFWSARVYEIFGRNPADGPLTLAELPARVMAEDVPVIAGSITTLTEKRQRVAFEFRTGHSDDVRHVSVAAEPILDGRGRLLALRCVIQDVTARRHVEAALNASHEQLERHRRHLAEELQRALLPTMHPALPGLRVGVRYQPAENSDHVGGDWYEAVPLHDGRVLIAVGDASGHGLPAAARMAQLRNALLGVAYTEAAADMILTCLNLVVFHNQEEAATATAIVGHFDPETRALSWARAGHPPPILVRDGQAHQLDNPAGTLLGATEEHRYELVTTQLRVGDLVVLYTDGLVERRSGDTADQLQMLLRAAARCASGDPEQDIHTLLSAFNTVNPEDDTCILALYVTPDGGAT